jgi:hypothetical protein
MSTASPRHGMTDGSDGVAQDDGVAGDEDEEEMAEPEMEKRRFDPNVGGGVDRDRLPESDFAGRNRSFPIVTQADVTDALQSIGRAGEGNYDAATLRRNIRRIARRKGLSVPKKDKAIAARHPATQAPPGGDRFDPAHYDVHMWQQPDKRPADLCHIRTVTGTLENSPIASSLANNPGSVTLQRIDAARAAAAAGTLPGNPSGNPAHRADFSPAPSGHGQAFGTTPQRSGGMPALGSPSIAKALTSEIGRRGGT